MENSCYSLLNSKSRHLTCRWDFKMEKKIFNYRLWCSGLNSEPDKGRSGTVFGRLDSNDVASEMFACLFQNSVVGYVHTFQKPLVTGDRATMRFFFKIIIRT